MAVTAINAVIAHVMFVTELDWLLALDPLAGVPPGAIDLGGDEQSRDQNKDRAKNRPAGKIIRAVTEYLWHRRRIRLRIARHWCPKKRQNKTRFIYCSGRYFNDKLRFFQTNNGLGDRMARLECSSDTMQSVWLRGISRRARRWVR